MENHPNTSIPNAKNSAEFVAPRHWIGTEELSANYWNDPATKEKRAQEFHDKPIETLDLIEKLDTKGLARRDFLTIMGASMAMASFACARRPVHKIIPYVVKPEEVVHGVANYYATTCPDTGYGLLARVRDGRPIKLEGSPEHPMSRGTLDARLQAAVLDLYDPDRLKDPVTGPRSSALKEGASGKKLVSWADADAAIIGKLKSIAAGSGRIRILSSTILSDSTRRLVNEFLGAFGNGALVEYDLINDENIVAGQAESYGTPVVPYYRFDKADVILSLGADFLGTWNNSNEYNRQWAENRKLNSSKAAQAAMSKFYSVESTMSLTGSNADDRLPVRVGEEYKVALAVAHELIVVRKVGPYAADAAVASALASYTADQVGAELGAGAAAKIKQIAKDLAGARGKSIVVAGDISTRTQNSLALQVATNLLNSTLGNEGVTIDGTAQPFAKVGNGFAGIQKLITDMKAGAVDALVVHGVNPAYALPASLGFEDASKKVPLVIRVADREDETGYLADYVLPSHHFLENWGDVQPRKGVVSLQQPTVSPLYNSRSFQDLLLTWIRGSQGGLRAKGLAAQIAAAPAETGTWHDYLKANWKEAYYPQSGMASFQAFWETALRDGVFTKGAAPGAPSTRAFRTASLAAVPAFKKGSDELQLALYAKVGMYDGRQANNAWLQEFPEPVSTGTWDNYVNIGPALAAKLGVKTDSVVEIASGDSKIQIPVYVQPGMGPNAVSIAVGYGRRAVGKVGNGVGVDVTPFIKAQGNNLLVSGHTVKIKNTGKNYKLAITQWHNASENRPIINDITLAAFKKNPATSNHTDPHLRMDTVPSIWPSFEYKGYRWGMAIDLNSCTGCGACVIGCQSENNIPVVGRNNVRVSREMHWLRIDRYYSGNPENPDVIFQPMLCQHCENAPCETVCPVLATVHNDEGLNEQVYNRCVGTRYCQNNCPYKVRRFNFFDHWKSSSGAMNMVWNPDVTVRSRGIMEKCTFCVQRIRDAKDKAKDEGRKIADGMIKTACQATCPTDAIVFGDINDPNSRVSKLRADQRAFRALEVLNTKPSISYMTKVRNKDAVPLAGHGTGSGSGHDNGAAKSEHHS